MYEVSTAGPNACSQPNSPLINCCEHVTPVLMQLYRLPMQQCIEFKLAGLVHRVLNGWYLQHLADNECRGHLLEVLLYVCKMYKKISSLDKYIT